MFKIGDTVKTNFLGEPVEATIVSMPIKMASGTYYQVQFVYHDVSGVSCSAVSSVREEDIIK